ncbi:MAG: hypothetical protein R3C05_28320 [Pirellulaceae bacterium]
MIFPDTVVEGEYKRGTPEFLHWQCREAALAAIDAWEQIHGPFASWHDDSTLAVAPDEGEDLNAYYDRKRGGLPERISFFHQKVGNKTYFSGASTDVVAHEAGHAFLDALRPDYWSSFLFEVNSFHEAFGDCIAIVTALHDKTTREKILPSLTKSNPVESTAEELAEGIRRAVPGHNAGTPRKARNNLRWGPQGSIPIDGGPGELIYEEHSFGQVFSGCFYDAIANVFAGMNARSEANLLLATQTVGKLLVKATQQAPQRSQYFREIGRLMVLIDEQENAASNRSAIRDAFLGHNIALGSSLTLAPQAAFADAPAGSRRGVASARSAANVPELSATAKRKLLGMIGVEKGKLDIWPVKIAGQTLQEAVFQHAISLDAVDERLKGVIAVAPQVSLVGRSHQALSIMGEVTTAQDTARDVETFAESLLTHGRIDFTTQAAQTRRGTRSAFAGRNATSQSGITHEVREIRGQKTLLRLRFACSGA